MNIMENLIQIVETKRLEYAELELKLDSLGILDGVIKRELTNAQNLLKWVLGLLDAESLCNTCKFNQFAKDHYPCDSCSPHYCKWEGQ